MKKDRIVNAIIFLLIGSFIVFSEQFSFAPGAAVKLGEYKYLIAFIFFSMSLFLIINRNK